MVVMTVAMNFNTFTIVFQFIFILFLVLIVDNNFCYFESHAEIADIRRKFSCQGWGLLRNPLALHFSIVLLKTSS